MVFFYLVDFRCLDAYLRPALMQFVLLGWWKYTKKCGVPEAGAQAECVASFDEIHRPEENTNG